MESQPQKKQKNDSSMQVTSSMIKILGICGSLRKSSKNGQVLRYMQSQAAKLGIEMEIADLSAIPFFNADTEDEKPESLKKLLQQMTDAEAFVFASPEYNYSLTPALKNALDWGSRLKGNVGFKGKAASIVSVGGGMKGSRSQHHLRQVAVFLDLFILNKPEVLLSGFDGTFDGDGQLVDDKAKERILHQLEALKELSLKLNPKSSEAKL